MTLMLEILHPPQGFSELVLCQYSKRVYYRQLDGLPTCLVCNVCVSPHSGDILWEAFATFRFSFFFYFFFSFCSKLANAGSDGHCGSNSVHACLHACAVRCTTCTLCGIYLGVAHQTQTVQSSRSLRQHIYAGHPCSTLRQYTQVCAARLVGQHIQAACSGNTITQHTQTAQSDIIFRQHSKAAQ